jgi:folate-dependent phosphoribosylglycinamide formyltransferase PurN
MRITVFTSNQPRHISLINALSTIADTVYAIQECKTIQPGYVDDIVKKSSVMQGYFNNVMESEKAIFGDVKFAEHNVRTLSLKPGDLSRLKLSALTDALNSDYYVIFGSSYIKGELVQFLEDNNAYNVHIGISPYYRGSSCNFWALYDGNPELVGATVHMLGKGLDSGDMLYHALPKAAEHNAFDLGMEAVKAAQDSLVHMLYSGKIREYSPVKQDKSLEIRYSQRADFTDEIASSYLQSMLSPQEIMVKLENRDMGKFLNPYIPL